MSSKYEQGLREIKVYKEGHKVKRNPSTAKTLLKKGCDLGVKQACIDAKGL